MQGAERVRVVSPLHGHQGAGVGSNTGQPYGPASIGSKPKRHAFVDVFMASVTAVCMSCTPNVLCNSNRKSSEAVAPKESALFSFAGLATETWGDPSPTPAEGVPLTTGEDTFVAILFERDGVNFRRCRQIKCEDSVITRAGSIIPQ